MNRYTKAAGYLLAAYIEGGSEYRRINRVTEESQHRLGDLLRDVTRLYDLAQETKSGSETVKRLQSDITRVIKDLNERFERYPTVFNLYFHAGAEEPVEFRARVDSTLYTPLESRLAHHIKDIADEGEIHRFRSCQCKRLFFQTRIDHDCCSEKCRRKKLTSSDAHKQKRREYYHDHLKGGKGIVAKKTARSVLPIPVKGKPNAKASK